MRRLMYIVQIECGEYDFTCTQNAFVTSDKEKAHKWANKFNEILKRWKKYAGDVIFGEAANHITDVESFCESSYNRYSAIYEAQKAYVLEVELR